MTMPSVIGLTLNYRDAGRTLTCVQSLLEDGVTYVLVWDNSADDGVSAADLRAKLGGDPRVTIEVSSHNLGFAAGVNRGLAWIRAHFPGAWVLLINNDAVLLKGATAALSAALRGKPEAVIAYPSINHGGEVIGTAYYQRYFALRSKTPLPGCIPYPSGCCQLLAPERLRGLWFDEDFFMYGEDVELGYRLGEQGMVHVPEILVVHEGSASSINGSIFYETHMVEGHWLLARKLARCRFDFWMLVLARLVTMPSRAIVRAIRNKSLLPLHILFARHSISKTFLN